MFGHVAFPHLVYATPPPVGPGLGWITLPKYVQLNACMKFAFMLKFFMYLVVQVALGVPELLSLPFPLLYQAVHHDHPFR